MKALELFHTGVQVHTIRSSRLGLSTFLLICLFGISSCATLTAKPIKPSVELIRITPLNISLSEQKLRFDLKVSNPNSFAMPIKTVDFLARFNNTDIASGKSNQSVTIDANSEAILSLDVTAGLDRLASTLSSLLHGKSINLEYQLSGSVEVTNWPSPIPFNVIGAMDLNDT